MKKVEDLVTEDFLRSADSSPDVRIDQSTVVKVERRSTSGAVLITFSVGRHQVQVRVEAALEHPFYVFDRGWASCAPALTLTRYQLTCQPLNIGDVCISLTHKVAPTAAAPPPSLLMPPPEDPAVGGRESRGSPRQERQVGFQEVPSVYRINPESPPNQRDRSRTPPPLSLVKKKAEKQADPTEPSQGSRSSPKKETKSATTRS